MKKIVHVFLFVFFATQLTAQDFTGQWKGEFVDNSTAFVGWGGDRCEYVLEIECKGSKVTGYSYTYFSDGGKKYYTICKLKGTLNKASKYIEVTETERTKTNVPITVRNCFQIHRLTYYQQGDDQTLEGTWIPVPNQNGDCGYGTTVLSRRILKRNPSLYNEDIITKKTPPKKTSPPVVKNTPKKTAPPAVKTPAKQTNIPPVAKAEPKKNVEPPVVKSEPEKKTDSVIQKPEIKAINLPHPKDVKAESPEKKLYENRNSELIKTIEIDNDSITVNLYDNGEIDGDSISLFFNGKLLLSHKRLSDKAISLKLNVDASREVNELVMYAENLGTIPPNTALMVVNDGDNRYEVRISSDLQKSGVIRFVHKLKPRQ